VCLLRECIASIIITANVVPSMPILVTLMMEVTRSSKMSVLTRATWRNIPEDEILHSYSFENLKSNFNFDLEARRVCRQTTTQLSPDRSIGGGISTIGSHIVATPSEGTEDMVHATVNSKCSHELCKSQIHPITNLNLVSSHLTYDNTISIHNLWDCYCHLYSSCSSIMQW
jgi:hypothetical protein